MMLHTVITLYVSSAMVLVITHVIASRNGVIARLVDGALSVRCGEHYFEIYYLIIVIILLLVSTNYFEMLC